MSQLINIYTFLITNRKHEREPWRNEYIKTTTKILNLRKALENSPNADLNSDAIYGDNSFNSKDDLINILFANTSNGVSSNGQSIFSGENKNTVINDADFLNALKKLILDPNLDNHNLFTQVWNDKLNKNNPVQTNRATAACTLDVSSTVDFGKFDEVYIWLVRKKLIPRYIGDNNWYEKNIYVVDQIRKAIAGQKGFDNYWCNIFIWEIYAHLANPFNLKKQVVKYGAPGTGKTYNAKAVANLQFDIWKEEFKSNDLNFNDNHKVVQFHPSYSYEDFMEGLRPVIDENNQAQLQLVNGIFKATCISAGQWEIDAAQLCDSNGELDGKTWEKLTIKDLEAYKEKLSSLRWQFVFAETDTSKKLIEVIPPYFIIIDEINRAELSRVFGELMYCLEYRGIKGAIETQYNQLNTNKTGMLKLGKEYKFFVPHNVYIIGTMNTVDRSVESFDFALRRRFKWEEVKPSISLLQYHLQSENPSWVSLAENLRKLNKSIRNEPLLGEDFQIGHAYLMHLNYNPSTGVTEVRKLIWKDSIYPLLQEYVRGTGRENEILENFARNFGV